MTLGQVYKLRLCVESFKQDQCVLQFTLILAAGCALHRRTSRVIHRSELFRGFLFCVLSSTLTVQERREQTKKIQNALI